ncbi:uncharacterized protein LOC143547147 [Bidens hawaiensis]|uniref:uncharacterized protein LOC143547147 n=1 Tax=Bidens hawaiensis TaxID=980011 RepID=UPI004049E4AD
MEAFSLLRYWRTNGVDTTKNDFVSTPTATTIVTGVSSQTSETEDDDDDGPFFDLEFSLPGDEIGVQELVKNCEENEDEEEEDSDGSLESEEDDDDESELKLTPLFQSGSSGDSTGDVVVSVSDDLFGFEEAEEMKMKSNPPPQSSRATKLRVMMLKLKKSKLKTNSESTDKSKKANSSKPQNEEKKFTKKAMQEYLRKVKPLYSKRYGDKLKFTGQLSLPLIQIQIPNSVQKQSLVAKPTRVNQSISNLSEPPLLQTTLVGLKQGNLPAGLRVVCNHLRKSRSAITAAPLGAISSNRRDDSLLQQQDGIQSAILHCKRSFKASRDSDCSSNEVTSRDGKCENGLNSDAAEGKETPEMNKS